MGTRATSRTDSNDDAMVSRCESGDSPSHESVVITKEPVVITSGQEEFMHVVGSDRMEQRRKHRYRLLYVSILVVVSLVIVIVAVSIVFATKQENASTVPELTADERGIRYEEISAAIEEIVGPEKLHSNVSFKKALRWLAHDDPAMLETGAKNLAQRFFMASTYFATSTRRPWNSCGPPEGDDDDTCFWMKVMFLTENAEPQITGGFRWLSGVSECHWIGVECNIQEKVQLINLIRLDMTGTFPEGLLFLSSLVTVVMADGHLSGTLPRYGLSRLSHLEVLNLGWNELYGRLPEMWPPTLRSLNLSKNKISGRIFSHRDDQWQEIKNLRLEDNELTGSIPDSMGSLSRLEGLNLNANYLTGAIPTSLGQNENLKYLNLAGNDLIGTIPTELGEIEALHSLALQRNARLGGTVPASILPGMASLKLFDCNFTDDFTEKFTMMPDIMFLQIENNRFFGSVPDHAASSLQSLKSFRISGNDFVGRIPDSLCDLRNDLGFSELVADCGTSSPEVECAVGCCTACCDPFGENCQLVAD